MRPGQDKRAGGQSDGTPGGGHTWNFHPGLIDNARRLGAHGYLSKTLAARELVSALEAIHAGEIVISQPPARARTATGLNWPDRQEGLTDREAEILALITPRKSNADVAALTYLSPNTVKSYIRTTYCKIDVASRTQAVLWSRTRIQPRSSPHRTLALTGASGRASIQTHGFCRPGGLLHDPYRLVIAMRCPTSKWTGHGCDRHETTAWSAAGQPVHALLDRGRALQVPTQILALAAQMVLCAAPLLVLRPPSFGARVYKA